MADRNVKIEIEGIATFGWALCITALILGHMYVHANHDRLFIECVHADPDVVSFEVCADIFGVDSVDLDGIDTNWLDSGPAPAPAPE